MNTETIPKHPVDAVVEEFTGRDGVWRMDLMDTLERAYQAVYETSYPFAALGEVEDKLRKRGVRIWSNTD